MATIICIDTDLYGYKNAIAAYLIPYSHGAVLIDTGPGSTLGNLKSALAIQGIKLEHITHVLLTHIHLDHAGAAGWLARQGAQIYVHPIGAPHLLNPEKLLASARRIYGERMDDLWGKFLSVPATNLLEVQDGAEIAIGNIRIMALYTPGHADHHVSYFVQDTCFSGDAGGVRKPGPRYIRLPFVPPETHLGKWRNSLNRIKTMGCKRIALTHFGIYDDAQAHLELACRDLDMVEQWLETVMPEIPDVKTLQGRFTSWLHEQGQAMGLGEGLLKAYDFASPIPMGASGLFRYWHKVRMAE